MLKLFTLVYRYLILVISQYKSSPFCVCVTSNTSLQLVTEKHIAKQNKELKLIRLYTPFFTTSNKRLLYLHVACKIFVSTYVYRIIFSILSKFY